AASSAPLAHSDAQEPLDKAPHVRGHHRLSQAARRRLKTVPRTRAQRQALSSKEAGPLLLFRCAQRSFRNADTAERWLRHPPRQPVHGRRKALPTSRQRRQPLPAVPFPPRCPGRQGHRSKASKLPPAPQGSPLVVPHEFEQSGCPALCAHPVPRTPPISARALAELYHSPREPCRPVPKARPNELTAAGRERFPSVPQ